METWCNHVSSPSRDSLSRRDSRVRPGYAAATTQSWLSRSATSCSEPPLRWEFDGAIDAALPAEVVELIGWRNFLAHRHISLPRRHRT